MTSPNPEWNDRFKTAVQEAMNLSQRPDNATLLKIYALYKQATEGDVNQPRPGMIDLVGRAKWDAWNQLKGQTREEAQIAYIELINTLS